MASIDHTNHHLLTAVERDYARILKAVVTEIFDNDPEIASSFERALEESPARERLLALHESPLDLAAALTGRSINERMRGQYDRLIANARSEYPPQEFDELADPHDRPPVEFIGHLLNLLGYEPIHGIADNILVWKPSTSVLPIESMRPVVLTPTLTSPPFEHMTVSKRTIVEFLNYVFMRRLSDSDIELILKILLSAPDKR